MKLKRFNELLAGTRYGQGGGRTVQAMRLHLVDGLDKNQAARAAHVSRQALTAALAALNRERCPRCGGILPQDRAKEG